MKERPILFSAPMVRALLDGSKTQTRRVVKPQPPENADQVTTWHHPKEKDGRGPRYYAWVDGGIHQDFCMPCPYGQPGDQLWVRETFSPIYPQDPNYNGGRPIEYDYAATYTHGDRLGDSLGIRKHWKPCIHMPRVASRIQLEITGVRVERLQDISEADAMAEGARCADEVTGREVLFPHASKAGSFRLHYRDIWESINGPGSWDLNPWVWVIEFKKVTP